MTKNLQNSSKAASKTPAVTFRKKFIAFFLTLALACTGFAVAPATAFADDASGDDAVFVGEIRASEAKTDASKKNPLTSLGTSGAIEALSGTSVVKPLATVGTVTDLATAVINAPQNTPTTIQLTADIDLGAYYLPISKGQDITLTGAFKLKGSDVSVGNDYLGTVIWVDTGAKLTLSGITVINTSSKGAGVGVESGGTLTLKSGTISGCKDTGVFSFGNIAMTGGTITKCMSAYGGGGVVVAGGTFKMSGGKITENKSSVHGGGVYVSKGTFTMTGGTISKNKATKCGAGLVTFSTFKMSGGKIIENTASQDGGGAYVVKSGNMNITKGAVTDNVAKKFGGGVATEDYAKLKVAKKGKFSDNRAKGAYKRLAKYNKIYKKNIKSKKWSYNLKQGYNNFDIAGPYLGAKTTAKGKPSIKGASTIKLRKGYAKTSKVYVGKGYPAPKFSITKNTGSKKVTINSKGKLTIPKGLKKGNHKITIQAKNSSGVKTKTITIKVS
ncbi:MAG: hypothetical protein FWG00_03350 [Coriobacteriia bacterium]|nr:hypothetical protein [Coriobacteriia bacterium]